MSKGRTGAILLGLGAAGVITALVLKNTVDTLQALDGKVTYIKKDAKATITNPKFLVSVEISNPNKHKINFKSFIADVIVNKNVVGKINFVKTLLLASQDKTIIKDIPFSIDSKAALTALFTGKNLNLVLVDGTIKVDGFALPVKQQFDLKKS